MMEKKSRTKKRTTGCNDELEPLVARMGNRLDGREETDGKENFLGKNGKKLLNIVNCLVDYDFFVVNLKFI